MGQFRRRAGPADCVADPPVGTSYFNVDSVATASLRERPDFPALWDKLVDLGVLRLPAEAPVRDQGVVILDGLWYVVEVRVGTEYRASVILGGSDAGHAWEGQLQDMESQLAEIFRL